MLQLKSVILEKTNQGFRFKKYGYVKKQKAVFKD